MTIKWLGHSSFYIKTEGTSFVTDPYNPRVGLTFPNISADIVTVSHNHYDHSFTSGVGGNPKIVDKPGGYGINNVQINGIESFHDNQKGSVRGPNIIFKFYAEGINLAHFGDLGHVLNDDQIHSLLPLDIIMLPIGGTYTIGPDEANIIIDQVKPKIILPMHYHTSGLTISTHLSSIDDLFNKTRLNHEKLTELIISKEMLPVEPKIITF